MITMIGMIIGVILVAAGIFYLIMNAIVSKVFSVIEKRMNYYR